LPSGEIAASVALPVAVRRLIVPVSPADAFGRRIAKYTAAATATAPMITDAASKPAAARGRAVGGGTSS
jgi:hypothetical protein